MLLGLRNLCCKDTLYLPVFIYGFVKEIIPTTENQEPVTKIILFTFWSIVSLILCVPLLCFIVIMSYYFEIAKSLAKYKFHPNYVDYIKGKDAVFSYDKVGGNPVISWTIIAEDLGPDTPAKLVQMFREHTIETVLPLHPHLSCTAESFMGYLFYVHKQNLDMGRIIHYMDDYQDDAEYREILSKIISAPLPYESKFMWEIHCGKQLVETCTGERGYPVIFRVHHTCMDVVTVYAFITCLYAKDGVKTMEDLFKNIAKRKLNSESNNFLDNIVKWLKKLWNTEVYYHHNIVSHIEPESPLHVENPCGPDKVIGISCEHNRSETVKMIKLIRNTMKVSFTDVINGAVAAAITEYYVNHNLDFPPFLTVLSPYMPTPEVRNVVQIQDENIILQLGNKIMPAFFKLPLNRYYLDNPDKFISAAHRESMLVTNSLDLKFIIWVADAVCTVIPRPIIEFTSKGYDCTTAITNIPGLESITLQSGHRIIDAYLSATHYKKTRTSMALSIYDNRMHFIFTVDNEFLPMRRHADDICENVFKYINRTYETLLAKSVTNNEFKH